MCELGSLAVAWKEKVSYRFPKIVHSENKMSIENKKSRTFKFTQLKLQHALYPKTSGEVIYHDSESSCLKLRVTKNQKTFYFIRKIGKTTKKVKLGIFSSLSKKSIINEFITVDEARDLNNEIKDKIKKGEDFHEITTNNIIDENKEDNFTINDAMEEFYVLFEIKIKDGERSLSSLIRIKQNYKNHIKNILGNKQFISVTTKEITTLLFNIRKVSASVYNKCLILLKSLYNSIIDHRELNIKNPANSKKLKKVPSHSRTRFLQPAEIQKFFEALKEEKQIYQDFIICLLFTAQRKGNLLSMKWSSIDLKYALWHLNANEIKGKKAITVPLNEILVTILKRRYKERDINSNFVFASTQSRTGHICEKTSKGSFWYRIRNRANLWNKDKDLNIVIHDLRRSLASFQALNNVSLQIIAGTLGHTDLKQTQVYARLRTEEVRKGMDIAINSIIENIDTNDDLMKSMGLIVDTTEKSIKKIKLLFSQIYKVDLIKNNQQYMLELKELLEKIITQDHSATLIG